MFGRVDWLGRAGLQKARRGEWKRGGKRDCNHRVVVKANGIREVTTKHKLTKESRAQTDSAAARYPPRAARSADAPPPERMC